MQSESFDAGTPVFNALIARARRGDTVTLAVNAREARAGYERSALTQLRGDGVHILLCYGTAKMALQGNSSWAGSSNLTRGLRNQFDSGFVTSNPTIVSALARAFGH